MGAPTSTTVDPGLVALLLSSVWGVRWKLGELGWNWIPKDPFVNMGEFLRVLQSYQVGYKRTEGEISCLVAWDDVDHQRVVHSSSSPLSS